jgi:metal-responsive CopG/Arc/MetJ family transcriptional regulator
MSKQVISFRLSKEDLAALDEVCRRLDLNRSEAVSAGIAVLLAEYVNEKGTLLRRAPWFMTDVTGDASEQS